MTPFARQFDKAQYDPEWRNRFVETDLDVLDEEEGEDDYITHMKFECRQGRFV